MKSRRLVNLHEAELAHHCTNGGAVHRGKMLQLMSLKGHSRPMDDVGGMSAIHLIATELVSR